MSRIAFRFRLTGRVQGVSCRDGTVALAAHHRVDGAVRNVDDGDVEGIVAGSEAAVGAFLVALRQPSPRARVDRIALWPTDPEPGLSGFVRQPTVGTAQADTPAGG